MRQVASHMSWASLIGFMAYPVAAAPGDPKLSFILTVGSPPTNIAGVTGNKLRGGCDRSLELVVLLTSFTA
jgi:hypothetical protein